DLNGHLGSALAPQPLLNDRRLLQSVWAQDFTWNVSGIVIELGKELLQHIRVAFALGIFEHEVLTSDEFSMSNEKTLCAGLALGPGKGGRILVAIALTDDFWSGGNPFDAFKLIAIISCFLELQFGRGPFHFTLAAPDDMVGFPVQEVHQAASCGAVSP